MTQIAGYCTICGAGWEAGQNYCGKCGTALATAGAAGRAGATFGPAATGADPGGTTGMGDAADAAGAGPGARAAAGPADDAPYPREAIIGAVLLTLFMPIIALIAALALRAHEIRPGRREQLRNWAVASGAWLATGWVLGIVVFASVLSAAGPPGCQGGINYAVPPSYQSSDGKHWVGTFTCMNGGTITKPVPASQVPGG